MSDTSVPSVRQKKYGLVHDWHWLVNHAWSVWLLVLSFLFSVAEVALPFILDSSSPNLLYAGLMAFVTGAALILRFVAQREIGDTDG
jgi:hypothetical protein